MKPPIGLYESIINRIHEEERSLAIRQKILFLTTAAMVLATMVMGISFYGKIIYNKNQQAISNASYSAPMSRQTNLNSFELVSSQNPYK